MKTQDQYFSEHAQQRGRDALTQARACLERALRDLDHFDARFEQADSLRDKADVMNWTLNHLANIMPNLRLDLIAGAQAELAQAHAQAHTKKD
jgi:hypothetical protein